MNLDVIGLFFMLFHLQIATLTPFIHSASLITPVVSQQHFAQCWKADQYLPFGSCGSSKNWK